MKKFVLVFLNVLILSSVLMAMYHSYIEEKNSEIDVTCNYNYVVSLNSLLLSCDVDDKDSIISIDNPLKIYLFDDTDTIVLEQNLINGINELEFDVLNYNSQYSVSIEGSNFIREEFVSIIYSELDFSTARSDLIAPTYVLSENLVTDTEYHFFINLIDLDDCAESIDITLYNESDEVLITQNYTNFSNLDFSFADLEPSNDYSIGIDINYIINDFNELSTASTPSDFTTLDLQSSPSAELSNIYNNNIDLTFDLTLSDNDATDIIYSIELVDSNDVVLYTETPSSTSISIDVNAISGNYFISVKVSYTLNGTEYNDVELENYSIYSSELANFFLLSTLTVVNTDLPLTSYDDYADYIYTFLNQGLSEFSIVCEAPLDCSELVTNDLYSVIPFTITDFVNAYNDVNTLSYAYSSAELVITLGKEYTLNNINVVDQEVETILNLIITEPMSEYDKILAVHDYVVNNTVYDTECYENSELCDTDHIANGVFFDELAVCEGYAHAIDILLRALEIPTFKLSSTTHQWNAVYYDGAWYHLDATWDDPVTMNGTHILNHNYFLITSAQLLIEDPSITHEFLNDYNGFLE